MKHQKLVLFLLRAGLASVFLYAAISSFINPSSWIGYFPTFLRHFVPEKWLLIGFSLYEIFLSLWLLSNKKIFYAAVLSALTLAGIIITSPSLLDITFRDFGLLAAALALALATY